MPKPWIQLVGILCLVTILANCGSSTDGECEEDDIGIRVRSDCQEPFQAPNVPVEGFDNRVVESDLNFLVTHDDNVNRYMSTLGDWWDQVKECSGIFPAESLGYDEKYLHLHFVPDNKMKTFTTPDGVENEGAIWVEYRYAKIIASDLFTLNGKYTRHQMLHYLLYLDGQNRMHSNPVYAACNV